MSGRINPREYDLGELRDAVSEASRHDGEPTPGDERDENELRRSNGASNAETAADSTAPPSAVSATEDPETYLRVRHQRGRFTQGSRAGTQGRNEVGHDRFRGERPDFHSDFGRDDGRSADFEFLGHPPGESVSRPYLEELPGTYSAQLEIFEWLDELISKVGREGAISALEYYESIEWLSPESRAELEAFVDGLETAKSANGSLGIADHRESLAYVARLASRYRR